MSNHHHLDHSPFLVPPGKKIKLKDYDPGFTSGFKNKDDGARRAAWKTCRGWRRRRTCCGRRKSTSRDHPVAGARRRGQGRHDRARDVGRQSAGRVRPQVQSADRGGAAAPLSLAADAGVAGARARSRFSTAPTTKKCSWCECTRSSSTASGFRPSLREGSQEALEDAVRRNQRVRSDRSAEQHALY